jgi:hypothetical protein
MSTETERVRALYETQASKYDKGIRFWEWLLFDDGRAWLGSRALGDVLEIASGAAATTSYASRSITSRQRASMLNRSSD